MVVRVAIGCGFEALETIRVHAMSTHMLPRYDAQALWLSQSLTVTWLDQHIPTAPVSAHGSSASAAPTL